MIENLAVNIKLGYSIIWMGNGVVRDNAVFPCEIHIESSSGFEACDTTFFCPGIRESSDPQLSSFTLAIA
jgi:hypothetical protein